REVALIKLTVAVHIFGSATTNVCGIMILLNACRVVNPTAIAASNCPLLTVLIADRNTSIRIAVVFKENTINAYQIGFTSYTFIPTSYFWKISSNKIGTLL